MKNSCVDCKKETDLYDLIQVPGTGYKGVFNMTENKYKLVCDACFQAGRYKFIGRIERK